MNPLMCKLVYVTLENSFLDKNINAFVFLMSLTLEVSFSWQPIIKIIKQTVVGNIMFIPDVLKGIVPPKMQM